MRNRVDSSVAGIHGLNWSFHRMRTALTRIHLACEGIIHLGVALLSRSAELYGIFMCEILP